TTELPQNRLNDRQRIDVGFWPPLLRMHQPHMHGHRIVCDCLSPTSRPLKKSADWRRLSPARTGSEMMAIANVGLDDPPAAVELAVRLCAHADAANSFGSRVRL